MFTRRLKLSALAAVASFAIINSAHAADMPAPVLAPAVDFSGWYLRGDIGFSNQNVRSLFNVNYANFISVQNIDKGFDAAPLFGLGIGYTVNNWLRFDFTGEYRGAANFHGLDVGALPAGGFADDRYTGSKSEWTFLFNGYVDLGTWWNITPFVGAGVGFSRNTISNFGDISVCVNSLVGCSGSGGSDAFGPTAPGRCMPVSPTSFIAMSRSSLPTAISTWAMQRVATSSHSTAPTTSSIRWNSII
jgi:opacity protein-like surface antigen